MFVLLLYYIFDGDMFIYSNMIEPLQSILLRIIIIALTFFFKEIIALTYTVVREMFHDFVLLKEVVSTILYYFKNCCT